MINGYDLDINKCYYVKVHGWVMLSKVEAHKYRLEVESRGRFLGKVVHFYRPKGKKRLVSHMAENINLWRDNTDLNYIQLLRVEDK